MSRRRKAPPRLQPPVPGGWKPYGDVIEIYRNRNNPAWRYVRNAPAPVKSAARPQPSIPGYPRTFRIRLPSRQSANNARPAAAPWSYFPDLRANAPGSSNPRRRPRPSDNNAPGPRQPRQPNSNTNTNVNYTLANASNTNNSNNRPANRPANPRAPRQPRRGARAAPAPARPAELPLNRRNNPNAAVAAANERNADGMRVRFGPFALKPHQRNACTLFVKPGTRGLLLYYRVGSGKTLTAIACVENLAIKENRVRGVVVIAPASLVKNFQKELRESGVARGRYEVLSFDAVHNLHTKRDLAAWGAGKVVIIDEAQNLRNPSSKRLESVLALCSRAHKTLLLSGTPVMNYPIDIGALLGLLNPANVPRTIKVPNGRYKNTGAIRWKLAFESNFGRNADKNRKELGGMLRCTSLFYEPGAQELRNHYPTKTETWVPVPMTKEMVLAQHGMVESTDYATLRDVMEGKVSIFFLTHPREMNNHFTFTDRAGNKVVQHPKIDEAVRRVVAEYERGGKCVVYSCFIENGLDRISQLLTARNVPNEVFDGSLSKANKEAMRLRYNEGTTRVLLLSDAGKEGLDLKNTNQIHIMEPAWNEEKISQVIGRGVRYESHPGGGHVDVFRYYCVFPPGDEYKQYVNPAAMGEHVLYTTAADEVLKLLSDKKNTVNKEFLAWLIGISDGNLRSCLR